MKFSIFVICCLLLPKVYQSITTATSYIQKWPVGTTFQPANAVELLSTLITPSFFICSSSCNVNVQCRTFVYDSRLKQCTLYEGDVSTGAVIPSNSTTTQIGSIRYYPELYNCYDKTDNQCSFNRYLITNGSSNVGVCPKDTYWNGTMCLNQMYFGTACTSDNMCRTDLALACNILINQTCSGGYDVNIVKNGDAEIGPCNRSTGGISPPFWSSTGLLTQLFYNDTDGAVFPSSPGPSDRGNCYFWGGTNPYVYMYQLISLNIYSSAIDQNKISYNFSAWVGGWGNQDDAATLWVNFYNSSSVIMSNITIAPVYASDRNNVSELLYRQITGMIPINTRSVTIYVSMTAATYNNDGSVDDICFKLGYIP